MSNDPFAFDPQWAEINTRAMERLDRRIQEEKLHSLANLRSIGFFVGLCIVSVFATIGVGSTIAFALDIYANRKLLAEYERSQQWQIPDDDLLAFLQPPASSSAPPASDTWDSGIPCVEVAPGQYRCELPSLKCPDPGINL